MMLLSDSRVFSRLKVGFHYQSSRPELTTRELGPWTRVVETDLYVFQTDVQLIINHASL